MTHALFRALGPLPGCQNYLKKGFEFSIFSLRILTNLITNQTGGRALAIFGGINRVGFSASPESWSVPDAALDFLPSAVYVAATGRRGAPYGPPHNNEPQLAFPAPSKDQLSTHDDFRATLFF